MSDKPAYCRDTAFDNFRCALADLESTNGLVTAACAVAQHELGEDTSADVLSKIDKLGRSVMQGISAPTTQTVLAHMHDLLFDVIGLRGNDEKYYDPANSYLPLVLSRRRGIPITLTLIYKAVAERAGLHVCGINAPGHFLAGVFEDALSPEPTLIVDPFYGGKVLTHDEAHSRVVMASGTPYAPDAQLLQRASHADWLMRMLNNLLAIFAHTGQERNALAMRELHAALSSLN